MLATIALFVVCAVSFVGTLAVLYGYVVPTMLAWWGREFDLQSEIRLVAVVVPAGIVLLLAIGSVRNFYLSPLSETNAQEAPESEYPELHARPSADSAQQADVPAPSLSRSRLERPERVHRRSHAEPRPRSSSRRDCSRRSRRTNSERCSRTNSRTSRTATAP